MTVRHACSRELRVDATPLVGQADGSHTISEYGTWADSHHFLTSV
jgi:hypothetical protein